MWQQPSARFGYRQGGRLFSPSSSRRGQDYKAVCGLWPGSQRRSHLSKALAGANAKAISECGGCSFEGAIWSIPPPRSPWGAKEGTCSAAVRERGLLEDQGHAASCPPSQARTHPGSSVPTRGFRGRRLRHFLSHLGSCRPVC